MNVSFRSVFTVASFALCATSLSAFADLERKATFVSPRGTLVGEVKIESDDGRYELDLEVKGLRAGNEYTLEFFADAACQNPLTSLSSEVGRRLVANSRGRIDEDWEAASLAGFDGVRSVALVNLTRDRQIACGDLRVEDDDDFQLVQDLE
jgi:hypothetical protein